MDDNGNNTMQQEPRQGEQDMPLSPQVPPAVQHPYTQPASYNPAPPPPVTPPPKGRRVGTLTMALCLIAVGALLLLRLVMPLDLVLIAQLSPVILILLGCEILYANIRHKDEKLRYDALSVFICLLLIAGSLLAAVIPEQIVREIESNQINRRLETELEDLSYELIETQQLPVRSVDWYLNVQGRSFKADMGLQDLNAADYVQVWVTMSGDYTDRESFARDCRLVLDNLAPLAHHLDFAGLYSKNHDRDTGSRQGDMRMALRLDNNRQMQMQPGEMEEYIDVECYWPEGNGSGYYMTEEEYIYRLENPEEYGDVPEDFYEGNDVDGGTEPDESMPAEEQQPDDDSSVAA